MNDEIRRTIQSSGQSERQRREAESALGDAVRRLKVESIAWDTLSKRRQAESLELFDILRDRFASDAGKAFLEEHQLADFFREVTADYEPKIAAAPVIKDRPWWKFWG